MKSKCDAFIIKSNHAFCIPKLTYFTVSILIISSLFMSCFRSSDASHKLYYHIVTYSFFYIQLVHIQIYPQLLNFPLQNKSQEEESFESIPHAVIPQSAIKIEEEEPKTDT